MRALLPAYLLVGQLSVYREAFPAQGAVNVMQCVLTFIYECSNSIFIVAMFQQV